MAKSKYREKQERGLVPARYPDRRQMRGAWQHWPQSVRNGRDMAEVGKHDLSRKEPKQSFVLPHTPINFKKEDERRW